MIATDGAAVAEIGRFFRDVDAIVNAWFARARLTMLALPAEELTGRPADKRIALAFGAWLDSLAPHRRVAAEILRHKLYPSHPHHWVALIFNLSRFVHDLLDVARVLAPARLCQAQEIGLTAITLATLADGLRDDSPAVGAAASDVAVSCLTRAGCLARCIQPATRGCKSCTTSRTSPGKPSRPPPRRAVDVDVEALLQRDLRHEQKDRHGGPPREPAEAGTSTLLPSLRGDAAAAGKPRIVGGQPEVGPSSRSSWFGQFARNGRSLRVSDRGSGAEKECPDRASWRRERNCRRTLSA